MTDREWDALMALLEEGWPGTFTDEAADSYRALLGYRDPAELLMALRSLVERGARYRPSPAEICGALNHDVNEPTWAEAYGMLFGPRGVVHVRASEEALKLADRLHPFVGAFVRAQGLDRLRRLPLEDPDWGGKERNDLGRQWDLHVEQCRSRLLEGRTLEALGRRERAELSRFDPGAALQRARAEIRDELEDRGEVTELPRRSVA